MKCIILVRIAYCLSPVKLHHHRLARWVAPKVVLVMFLSVLHWQATNSPAAAFQHFANAY